MFVRQLIGRSAGQIVEMPYAAAQSNIDMGTCARVTDQEVADAGFAPLEPQIATEPEAMPDGFKAIPTAGGGFDVVNHNGDVINGVHIPNQPAARSFALAYIEANPVPEADAVETGVSNDEPDPIVDDAGTADTDEPVSTVDDAQPSTKAKK